jgi:hypothetical protein
MQRVGSWFLMSVVALTLFALSIGIAELAHKPCARIGSYSQTAAAGSIAQYDGAEAGGYYGGGADESGSYGGGPETNDVYYSEEPCYGDVYYQQPYTDDQYNGYGYYDVQDTGYTGDYSGFGWGISAPPLINFVQQAAPSIVPIGYSAPAPTVTQTIVPIGTPTPPPSTPQQIVQNHYITIQQQAPQELQQPTTVVTPISYPYYTGQTYYSYSDNYFPAYQTPSCYLSPSAQEITVGDAVTLAWAATNATSAYLDGIGAMGTAGTYQFTPSASKQYTLRVYGPGGSSYCSAYVSVKPLPPLVQPPENPAPTCNISAEPATIFAGATSTLWWSAARATSASLSSVGTVAAKGSLTVTPSASQKYTLTVRGDGGTRTCSVAVAVQPASACTVTCNGVTYACAPLQTPVSPVCPQNTSQNSGGMFDWFWNWLSGLFQ